MTVISPVVEAEQLVQSEVSEFTPQQLRNLSLKTADILHGPAHQHTQLLSLTGILSHSPANKQACSVLQRGALPLFPTIVLYTDIIENKAQANISGTTSEHNCTSETHPQPDMVTQACNPSYPED